VRQKSARKRSRRLRHDETVITDRFRRREHADKADKTAASGNFFSRTSAKNWDEIAGTWRRIKGRVKEKWGKLTDDDLMTIDGSRSSLRGCSNKSTALQKRNRRSSWERAHPRSSL